MPELPDVEVFRIYLDSHGLYKTIEDVEIRTGQVLENVEPEELKATLKGKKFSSSHRHGKHLFVSLSEDGWLVFHFGMTGFFKYLKPCEEQPAGHPRILFHYEDKSCLAYDCQRKLGNVTTIESRAEYISRKDLGPDALSEVDGDMFREIFSNSRAMVKSTLMKQDKLAGIGNIYSDEILFQAGIYPRVKASSLSEEALTLLYDNMKEVLKEAIDSRVDPDALPSCYLLPNRSPGSPCPKCGESIEKIKVSGRSSYFCPNCQSDSPGG